MPGGTFLAGDLIGAGIGGIESIYALNQLKKQPPPPEESISPELQDAYNKTLQESNEGYTAPEKAAFQAEQNQAANTQYERAAQSGAGIGNAVKGAINANEVMSYDKFAADDARLKDSHMANLLSESDKIQEQKNRISDQREKLWEEHQQALGQTLNAGLTSIMKSFGVGGTTGSLFGQGEDSSAAPQTSGSNNSPGPGGTTPAANSWRNPQIQQDYLGS